MAPRLAYTLFMLLAAAVFLAVRQWQPKPAELTRLPRWQRLALVLAAFIGGTLAAKLPFVFSSEQGWWSGAAWLADGKTITVALLGGYLAVEITKIALGIRVKTGDSFALPLALAMAVGRWGCFFNGCCYGTVTSLPWGVDFGDGLLRHPTQIYESLFHFSMGGILIVIIHWGILRYQRLKLYLIAYGTYRFLTEFIRPEPAGWLELTFYQWVAVLLVGVMAVQWALDERLKGREAASVQPIPGASEASAMSSPAPRLG